MPVTARRALGVLLAVLGIVPAVLGAWIVVKLGPSGEASFSVTGKTPGAIVVGSDVLNSVDVPVRVKATRREGGSVRLAAAPSTDARLVLARSAVSTVSQVHYPAGTLDLRASGSGPLGAISSADVWRLAATGAGSADLVVDQGRGPETLVVSSGDATVLKDVTLTLTWAEGKWFFLALGMAMIGAIVAAFALNDLWQGRASAGQGTVPAPTASEVTR